jgi:hypothetical protein
MIVSDTNNDDTTKHHRDRQRPDVLARQARQEQQRQEGEDQCARCTQHRHADLFGAFDRRLGARIAVAQES